MESLTPIHDIKFPDGTKTIVLISDIHFGIWNFSTEWVDNIVEYFNSFLLPRLKDMKDKVLVIAGDFFDNRQVLDIGIMNAAMNVVTSLSKECPVYLLVGNHDIYKRNGTEINSLRIFEKMPGVVIIDAPTIVRGNEKSFLMLPWIGDNVKETRYLKENEARYDCAILHSEISGFRFDNNIRIIDGVDLTSINGKKLIFSGHIHKRQTSGNVCYIGSAFQLRRVDSGNDRGMYIINADTLENLFVKNDFSPKYMRFELRDLLQFNMSQLRPLVKNNYLDVTIKQEDVNILDVARLSDVLKECGARKMELTVDDMNEEISSSIEKVRPIEDIMNIPKLVKESIDGLLGVSPEDKKQIMDMNDKYFSIAVADSMKNTDTESQQQ
ncbi:hypothetical protein EOM86_08005 [Candidatus Nomurabacteria bacterium]|nr:hypothetical protein [Candidatus Nomurabacteria bacterium]